jgi:hypothetical protein
VYTRKDLIRDAGLAIPGAIALTMLGSKFAFADDGDFDGPLDVLSYALTLEYLEAEFYRQGNSSGVASGKTAEYLATIQSDEETHVMALQDTIAELGGDAVPAPMVDFGESFATQDSYLEAAYTFENLGVQAYLGAAPSLFQEKELLTAAASIFGVEARHAAIIGVLQNKPAEGGVYQGAFETPLGRTQVLEAAAPFIVSAETL